MRRRPTRSDQCAKKTIDGVATIAPTMMIVSVSRQREAEPPGRVGHEVDQHDVAQAADAQIGAGGQQHRARVRPQDVQNRHAPRGVRLQRSGEHRALGDSQPHPEADAHQHGAGDERHPPGPGGELFGGDRRGGDQEHQVREDDAGGQAQGDDAAEQAPPPLGGVLHGHQDGAAPLTAKGEALHEAEHAPGAPGPRPRSVHKWAEGRSPASALPISSSDHTSMNLRPRRSP